MKKTVTVEQSFCDFCGGECSGYNKCLGCGKDICYSCQKIHAAEYAHSVVCSGSGDGLYCQECEEKLTQSGDPLLLAYKRIRSLRNEYKGWYESFCHQSKVAELRVAELRAKAKGQGGEC